MPRVDPTPGPMTPGTYLRLRREAARLTVEQVAADLAGMPFAVRPTDHRDIERMVRRLVDAEADRDNLTVMQAAIALNSFPLDVEVYEALLIHFHARGIPSIIHGVPLPRVCRACACSARDGCRTDRGPCAWSATDPGLCTACERTARLAADLTALPDAWAAPDTQAEPSMAPVSAFAAARELGRSPLPAHERNLQHG